MCFFQTPKYFSFEIKICYNMQYHKPKRKNQRKEYVILICLDVPAFASLFFIICSFSSISPESVL